MKFLPGTKLMAKIGDKVEIGEILGEEVNQVTQSVDMSAILSKLSPEKMAELNLKKEEKFKQGELMVTESGWFGKKILAPVDGKIVKIDEFFNVEFSQGEKKVRKIISPVVGKVSKMEADNLTIEFGATEINGEGVNSGKIWADGLIVVKIIPDIGVNCVNKIVIIDEMTPTAVVKIEAVGGVGLVTKDARINSRLPVLVLEKTEFENIKGIKNAENKRVLLNTTGGRLLLVE